jgi:short-subunit dehydrogenase
MREQGRGQIVTTVSMAALVALPGSAAYSASKFGLRGFLIAFRAELEPYGVSVSMLLPSAIDTPMLRFEALNRGSALNFISKPAHVEVVGAVFKKAQKTKKLEYYIPYRDSIFGRLVCSFPAMLTFMYPLLSSLGERGRKQFIKANHLD